MAQGKIDQNVLLIHKGNERKEEQPELNMGIWEDRLYSVYGTDAW